mmetsp:Transcript_13580/g.20382  ORF Transcript_13580/g.20382 Transcript_13580/m.20382 type:complete len:200 (-) Transcript_13580:161-760(-)
MGNCCPCWKHEMYDRVPDNDTVHTTDERLHTPNNTIQQQQQHTHSGGKKPSHQTRSDEESYEDRTDAVTSVQSTEPKLAYDPNALPFKGCEVLQKFNNNQSYTKRYVWLNNSSRTIHMSQHMTKERRHKEASLADVTSVVAGPPVKKKPEADCGIADLCLTVNFKRGGGIDLQFKSKEERDSWYDTLLGIVAEIDRNKV